VVGLRGEKEDEVDAGAHQRNETEHPGQDGKGVHGVMVVPDSRPGNRCTRRRRRFFYGKQEGRKKMGCYKKIDSGASCPGLQVMQHYTFHVQEVGLKGYEGSVLSSSIRY